MDPRKNPFRRRGPSWIELSVALAALFVSGASLYIARQQTSVMHSQLAASIWPALQFSTSNLRGGEPHISMTVENVGIGPAHVRSVRMSYDGRPVADMSAFVRACCAPEGTPVRTIVSFLEGRIMPAGEEVELLAVPAEGNDPRVLELLDAARGALAMDVCYCSLLGDCWETSSGGQEPRAVRACPAPDAAP
jgi:hypothetical protein